jgi:aryl-alcohol dehydrogenase-like predicted oxidoreductase
MHASVVWPARTYQTLFFSVCRYVLTYAHANVPRGEPLTLLYLIDGGEHGGSGIWGEIAGLDREQAIRLVAIAVDHGINLIDNCRRLFAGKIGGTRRTGTVESWTRRNTHASRHKSPVANGAWTERGWAWRSHIARSVERSLKRLGRDHIDLLQLHDRDALVPIGETLRALDDLVTQGKSGKSECAISVRPTSSVYRG